MNRSARRGLAALLLLLLPFAAGCGDGATVAAAEVWYCPMHPDYVSDQPGSCPICHMDLVRRVDDSGTSRESAPAAEVWVCPMHPEVVSDHPGSCPICNMDLVPKPSESPNASGSGVPTHAAIELSPAGRSLAGVETAVAERKSWTGALRTVGTVLADERRTHRIEARFSGWIEKLPADFTGQFVRRGETLAEIFSPELLAAQQEYLLARDVGARFTTSSLPEVRNGGQDLMRAARRRLEIFALPPGFIEKIAAGGEAERTVPVVAPASGYLVSKMVFSGQQVSPGMEMFRLVDLSSIWVEASLYEVDAVRVRLGDEAELSLAYDPATARSGRVSYVYPEIDAATRTLRVRFDVVNPRLDWKPGMFVDVELSGRPREALVIPDAAVLDTGERKLVFVESEPGRFEPREVGVGERRSGEAEILSGLAAGERVAIRANFLLDSESRLRSALSARAAASAAAEPAAAEPAAGHEDHR